MSVNGIFVFPAAETGRTEDNCAQEAPDEGPDAVRKGSGSMLDFEEELAKFQPSRDIDQVEDTIVNRDITDVTDIMVEFLKEQYEQDDRE